MSTFSHPTTIEVLEFHAANPGPSLLIFGAVHGNEICGTKAIKRIVSEIEKGTIILDKGCVSFVPVANPLAYAKNLRYVKDNLNRIFKTTRSPRSDEARFANILCRLIDRCDAFLDIHSITAKGEAFLYLDFPTRRNLGWAKVLGAKHAVVGWPELYERMGLSKDAFDTTSYAAKQGKDCLLIECGQHQSPLAPKIAYEAILQSLHYHGLVRGKAASHSLTTLKMSAGYFRGHQDDRLAKNWKHLETVRKGQEIILLADGSGIKAPYDATLIMPKATAPVGDDWLYLSRAQKA